MPRQPCAKVARAVLSVVVDGSSYGQAAFQHSVEIGSVRSAVWRWRQERGLNGPPKTQQSADAPIPTRLRKQPRSAVGAKGRVEVKMTDQGPTQISKAAWFLNEEGKEYNKKRSHDHLAEAGTNIFLKTNYVKAFKQAQGMVKEHPDVLPRNCAGECVRCAVFDNAGALFHKFCAI